MSLTSLLESDKDLTAFLKTRFSKPRLDVMPVGHAPPICANNWLIGHAFDYVLTWNIERVNSPFTRRQWIAETALQGLRSSYRPLASEILEECRSHYLAYLESGEIADNVLISALRLARLDTVYRSGLGGADIGTPVHPADLADLSALVSLIPDDLVRRYRRCLINPALGFGSLGGADADLVLDNLLIEVKTIKRCELDRFTFNQVISYVLLSRIRGIPDVTSIGVYFARFGTVAAWQLSDLASEDAFAAAADWIESRYS
jgi:hypothetical protein